MSEPDDAVNEMEEWLPPISAYIWKPRYAKVYWALTPSLWVIQGDWMYALPDWLRVSTFVAALFTSPPIVFLILSFGWLEKFIHDPHRVWVEGDHIIPPVFPFEEGPPGMWPSMKPYDPLSAINRLNDPDNPLSPFYEEPRTYH